MANHSAAIKYARQSKKRRTRNQLVISSLKTLVKKMYAALDARKTDEANSLLVQTRSRLDRAVVKGIVHRNTASRRISRLTLKVQKGLVPQKSA